jgi:hypothetical protein
MRKASFFLTMCARLAAAGTAVLFLLPLSPDFPNRNFDASWAYALNEAVARHLIFGRDIVLTFGPLAFIYTKMYHPATDGIMLLGSAMLGAGLPMCLSCRFWWPKLFGATVFIFFCLLFFCSWSFESARCQTTSTAYSQAALFAPE